MKSHTGAQCALEGSGLEEKEEEEQLKWERKAGRFPCDQERGYPTRAQRHGGRGLRGGTWPAPTDGQLGRGAQWGAHGWGSERTEPVL